MIAVKSSIKAKILQIAVLQRARIEIYETNQIEKERETKNKQRQRRYSE